MMKSRAKRKQIIERAAYKSTNVSAMMGSVPHKMVKGLPTPLCAPCKNQTRVSQLSYTHLNHQAMG